MAQLAFLDDKRIILEDLEHSYINSVLKTYQEQLYISIPPISE